MAGTHQPTRLFHLEHRWREPWLNPEWHDPRYRFIGGITNRKKAKLLSARGVNDRTTSPKEKFPEEYLTLLEKHEIEIRRAL
jgi:hypothetical protein